MGGGPLASGLARLGTETAFSVLARANELESAGRDVIHLEIGEPGFDTPAHVKAAALEALAAGRTGYCAAGGIAEMREAAAHDLGVRRGIAVRPEEVLVGTGAKPFLFFGVLATCDAGARVVIPDPGFPIYESAVRWAGAVPVPVGMRAGAGAGAALDVDALAHALREPTALVILNSPHNPTGAVIGADELRAVADLIAETDAWVLSDEVYGRILFEGEFASIASLPSMRERTIVVDSMSKSFAMTGWRCGYAAVPRALRDPLERFIVNSTSCVPPFVQHAAVAALRGPAEPVERMARELGERCRLVSAGLDAVEGITCPMPGGAFYAFPDVRGVPLGADDLAARLLEEAAVAVLAGGAFGAGGAGHLRLSCAVGTERLAEAIARIETTVRGL